MTIYNHQAHSPLYVWPDVWSGPVHVWEKQYQKRPYWDPPGVIKQPKPYDLLLYYGHLLSVPQGKNVRHLGCYPIYIMVLLPRLRLMKDITQTHHQRTCKGHSPIHGLVAQFPAIKGAAASSLVARWAAESRVERSILLWGNVSSQLHLISPGCPRPNSALIVQKSGLKPVHPSIHPCNKSKVWLIHFFLTLKVLNFWKFTCYCSLKPLWWGMGEVVPARTSSTLHPPSPPTVHRD